MKLLILGGTRFLGRHLVRAALARNHEVTLFNRGKHTSEADVETIRGDRHTDLAKLHGRRWDAVVDTSGMLPRAVKAAAEALSDSLGVTENSPLTTLTSEQLDHAYAIDTSGEPAYGKLYGGLKALCEQAAKSVMPGRVLTIRPGLIVGADDYTDRFTYWVVRVARGGEVLAPGRPDTFVQFIDVRDLADWTLSMIERYETGAYNAHGLPGRLTMGDVLEECKSVSGSDASFTWASEEFLLRENVAPWSDMPLWLPEEAAPHLKGFMFINCEKAVGAGLRFRTLNDTIAATLAWCQANPRNELKAGLTPDREQSLLGKLHSTR
jgi:2'-hydroxyisoflavone reductase